MKKAVRTFNILKILIKSNKIDQSQKSSIFLKFGMLALNLILIYDRLKVFDVRGDIF